VATSTVKGPDPKAWVVGTVLAFVMAMATRAGMQTAGAPDDFRFSWWRIGIATSAAAYLSAVMVRQFASDRSNAQTLHRFMLILAFIATTAIVALFQRGWFLVEAAALHVATAMALTVAGSVTLRS
jgi:hypothetical protein